MRVRSVAPRSACRGWRCPIPGTAERVREAVSPSPCAVLDGRGDLDAWGPRDPGALMLAERVRERFDPAGACAPGLL